MISDLRVGASGGAQIVSAVRQLNILGEEQAANLQKAYGAMQVLSGSASMIAAATTAMEIKSKIAEERAVATTAALTATVAGIKIVAIAGIATAAAAAGTYAILSTIKGDTETSAGRTAIASKAMGGAEIG